MAIHNLTLSLKMRYMWTGDIGDIEEAIEHLHEALKSLKSGDLLECLTHHSLAVFLSDLFQRRGAVKDLIDAIKHYRTSISLVPKGHSVFDIAYIHSDLASDLKYLFSLTGNAEHLEESMALFRSAVESPTSRVRQRLVAAKNWAITARSAQHPSALTAYRKASPSFSVS
jgi:tetratricopeptide (TPR) repeat protein